MPGDSGSSLAMPSFREISLQIKFEKVTKPGFGSRALVLFPYCAVFPPQNAKRHGTSRRVVARCGLAQNVSKERLISKRRRSPCHDGGTKMLFYVVILVTFDQNSRNINNINASILMRNCFYIQHLMCRTMLFMRAVLLLWLHGDLFWVFFRNFYVSNRGTASSRGTARNTARGGLSESDIYLSSGDFGTIALFYPAVKKCLVVSGYH